MVESGGHEEECGLRTRVRLRSTCSRVAFTAGRYNNYNAFEVWVLENFLPAQKGGIEH